MDGQKNKKTDRQTRATRVTTTNQFAVERNHFSSIEC